MSMMIGQKLETTAKGKYGEDKKEERHVILPVELSSLSPEWISLEVLQNWDFTVPFIETPVAAMAQSVTCLSSNPKVRVRLRAWDKTVSSWRHLKAAIPKYFSAAFG